LQCSLNECYWSCFYDSVLKLSAVYTFWPCLIRPLCELLTVLVIFLRQSHVFCFGIVCRKSFRNWPERYQMVSTQDLARSGFFYLGNLDRTQCFSCGGVLRNWSSSENINFEHIRHFPHCKSVSRLLDANLFICFISCIRIS